MAWRYIGDSPQETTIALVDPTSEIPFDGLDQSAPDDQFVMTLDATAVESDAKERASDALSDELKLRVRNCEVYADEVLHQEYPGAAGRTLILRLIYETWPSEAYWSELELLAGTLTHLKLEVAGPSGTPRTVRKRRGT